MNALEVIPRFIDAFTGTMLTPSMPYMRKGQPTIVAAISEEAWSPPN